MTDKKTSNQIPISVTLNDTLEAEQVRSKFSHNKERLVYISFLSVLIGVAVSVIAKVLMVLITLITNLSFYGSWSLKPITLIENNWGIWIAIIPAIGGIIVGFTALYGSRGIQGHGIPEAMEQILTNKSRINPILTFLKPISSAIAIGTGGPFGAEGPIIATGGALGSTLGQKLKISHNERKILLSAGAAAGMTAIFGTPIAGLFLAIELLLFEYSPRSIIPCVLACITALAGYHLFFRSGPVFPLAEMIANPANSSIFFYSVIGIVIGLISILVTKSVYWIEDLFNKIPINWVWYPAIGGLFAGVIGFFSPHTLGVGYENITDILSGSLAIKTIMILCLLKLVSWAVSLASGTSGGTLAPLMTIGGGMGAGFGFVLIKFFPDSGVVLPLAALVGMMAMFTGASRALITSVIFGIESTGQFAALFPLLAGCSGAYFVSFLFMKNTIMTEKIARRGVKTPDTYEPDVLEEITVGRVMHGNMLVVQEDSSPEDIEMSLKENPKFSKKFLIVINHAGVYEGILHEEDLQRLKLDKTLSLVKLLTHKNVYAFEKDDLKETLETMAREGINVLPVLSYQTHQIKGIVTYQDIMNAMEQSFADDFIPVSKAKSGNAGVELPKPGNRIYKS